jgi:hypothetical protein
MMVQFLKKNIVQAIIFVLIMVLPSFLWLRFFYNIDSEAIMQCTFGLLNSIMVPIEAATVIITNIAGFCFLKRTRLWRCISLIYLTAAMSVYLVWITQQFVMGLYGQDRLGLLFFTGPNFLRDVYYIGINNIISCICIWIIFFSDINDGKGAGSRENALCDDASALKNAKENES